MNILVEGWRGINNSFSLVNQWQVLELLKSTNLYFKDIPFSSEKWNTNTNFSGLNKDKSNIINNIPSPKNNQSFDITYRISSPFNFDDSFNSKFLFVFGTCEYKYLTKSSYINNSIDLINNNQKIFIHTPSNWSKVGFIEAGFREDQVLVVPSTRCS